ncbi:MAG: UPF0149 family protein [Beijerinckiaceae bacterium]|nr:UPF0149 family protein [Beijerinckiaceae bacterium]
MRKLKAGDLERLDSFLCSLDSDEAMLLSALDGFLSGVVVCPNLILPSEWLPVIWGGAGPVFEDEHGANEILGLIMARYNEIACGLGRKRKHQPILEIDFDESAIWELWAEGFAAAMALRPDSWNAYDASDDENVQSSFRCIAALVSRALDGERMAKEIDDDVRCNAHTLIADCLETMNAARMKMHASLKATPAAAHVGRNDPCPCGSGKKFKKCCLN